MNNQSIEISLVNEYGKIIRSDKSHIDDLAHTINIMRCMFYMSYDRMSQRYFHMKFPHVEKTIIIDIKRRRAWKWVKDMIVTKVMKYRKNNNLKEKDSKGKDRVIINDSEDGPYGISKEIWRDIMGCDANNVSNTQYVLSSARDTLDSDPRIMTSAFHTIMNLGWQMQLCKVLKNEFNKYNY